MIRPILNKFQIKEEFSVLLMNSNPAVHPQFDGVRIEYKAASNNEYDSVILFTKNEERLLNWVPEVEKLQRKDRQLWLSY